MRHGRTAGQLTKIGGSWYLRIRTIARETNDGKVRPIHEAGKLLLDPAGQPLRKQFSIKIADVMKYPKACAGLDALAAKVRLAIEDAERAISSNVEYEKPDGNMPVADFFRQVFMKYVEQHKERSTAVTYENYWKCYLAEHFNHTRTLAGYTKGMAKQFIDDLCTRLSDNTVKHVRGLCSGIFTYACQLEYIQTSPFTKCTTLTGMESEEGKAYTEAEVLQIIEALQSAAGDNAVRQFTTDTAVMMILMAYYTGMRPSELAGLVWSAGTIDENKFVVNQAWMHGEVKGTKTSKPRVVTIPHSLAPRLNPALRLWRVKRPAEPWVFPNSTGKTPVLMTFLSTFIKKTLASVGMEWAGLYACRRGFGTRMMLMGLRPEELAQCMGNSIPVVMAHYFKDRDCKLSADGLQRIAAQQAQQTRATLQAKTFALAGEQ